MARQGVSKESLLDVAEQLCAEVGSQAVRHAEIARRAGIKPPSVYAHFDSLDGILSAVARRGLLVMHAAYEDLAEATDPVEYLAANAARLGIRKRKRRAAGARTALTNRDGP